MHHSDQMHHGQRVGHFTTDDAQGHRTVLKMDRGNATISNEGRPAGAHFPNYERFVQGRKTLVVNFYGQAKAAKELIARGAKQGQPVVQPVCRQ